MMMLRCASCSSAVVWVASSVISGRAEVRMAGATFELKERSSACSLCTEKMPGCPCFPNAVSVGEPQNLSKSVNFSVSLGQASCSAISLLFDKWVS